MKTGLVQKPAEWWLLCTGLLIFLLYLPDGLIHLKLGPGAYARDLLTAMHFMACLLYLEKTRRLLPFVRRAWPVGVLAFAFLGLFLAKTGLRDFLIHMKWVVFWLDWMLLGYLALRVARPAKLLCSLGALALAILLLDSAFGFHEVRKGTFFLPIESAGETASGTQMGRQQVMEGNVRAQGMQRSVFAFSNMMGLGFVISMIGAVWRRRGWGAFFFLVLAGWFFHVAWASGGRSSLLGIATVLFCYLWVCASRRSFLQRFPQLATLMLAGGIVVCLLGLGTVLAFLTSPFAGESRVFSMRSVYERDAIWLERLTEMNRYWWSWFTGMPTVHSLFRKATGVEFADNTLLYLVFHHGVLLTLVFLSAFYRAITFPARFAYPLLYIAFAMSFSFVVGEGIARDTLWYFGCMPMFFAMGGLIGAASLAPKHRPAPPVARTAQRRLSGAATLVAGLLVLGGVATGHGQSARLIPEEIAGVFLEGQEVVLRPSGGAVETWVLRDISGEELRRGDAVAEGNPLLLGKLPAGFYRLESAGGNTPVAVVLESKLQTRFCLDVGGSVLLPRSARINPFQPEDGFAALAGLAKRAGVGSVRDRMHWPTLHPAPGEISWRQYPRSIGEFATRGVEVMQMFHVPPDWAKDGLMTQPGNLFAAHEFARAAAKQFAGQITAWEFWNEPDENFCRDAAWDYAAGMKAASAGWQTGNPDAAVLIGSNALHPVPRFFEVVMENGAGDFFDIFNFHTYSSAGALPRMTSEKRAFLARYDAGDKPLWLTEIGYRPAETGRASGVLPGETPLEHDEEQEIRQAEFLVHTMVTGVSRGLERVYFFILTPYNEDQGKRPWGLLRWDWGIKPAYAALATMNALTAGKAYAGAVPMGPGVAAHLFAAADGVQSLVLWSDEAREVELEVNEGDKPVVRGLFGNQIRTDVKKMTVSRQPIWVDGLRGLRANPPPAKTPEQSRDVVELDREVVSSIRLGDAFRIENRIVATLAEPGTVPCVVSFWNFSKSARRVQPRDASVGVVVSGFPGEIEIPPGEKVDLPVEVVVSGSVEARRTMRVEGRTSAGALSPLVVPMRLPDDGLGPGRTIQIGDPARWRASASAFMKVNPVPGGEEVEFVSWFNEGTERWIYPVLTLAGDAERLVDSAGMSFEIRVLEGEAKKAFLMVGPQGKQGHQFAFKPADEWKRVAVVWQDDAPAAFDLNTAKAVKIGMNPSGDTIRYRVRNLKIHGAHAR